VAWPWCTALSTGDRPGGGGQAGEESRARPGEAKSILNRFRQEAQSAGILQHPNIVAIYEYGEDDSTAWLAMELVQGKSLREHLAAGFRPTAASCRGSSPRSSRRSTTRTGAA